MSHLTVNLNVLFFVALIFSIPVYANENDVAHDLEAVETSLQADSGSEKVQYEAGRADGVENAVEEVVANDKNPEAEIATMTGEPSLQEQSAEETNLGKEEVWTEISQAISGLNEMVGDEMFLDVRRPDSNRMDVRVDVNFWQRVRYETRVDLKNDISNIWHLYVLQYTGEENSSVYFIDDKTNKTIDIFSQYQ